MHRQAMPGAQFSAPRRHAFDHRARRRAAGTARILAQMGRRYGGSASPSVC